MTQYNLPDQKDQVVEGRTEVSRSVSDVYVTSVRMVTPDEAIAADLEEWLRSRGFEVHRFEISRTVQVTTKKQDVTKA